MRSAIPQGSDTILRRVHVALGAARALTSASAVATLAVLLAGCSGGTTTIGNADDAGLTGSGIRGKIVGTVTIGPICPVERIPPDPACQPTPEMFARVKILVRRPGGETVRQVDLDERGNYSVELEPGTYLVDTNRHGFGIGGGELDSVWPDTVRPDSIREGGSYQVLPVVVELEPGETERVDIEIDTGIR
jgi:hypothetical protein